MSAVPGGRGEFAMFPAVYDALNTAAIAALAISNDDAECGWAALMEASVASVEAFPPGSREAEAFRVILGMLEGAAATGVST